MTHPVVRAARGAALATLFALVPCAGIVSAQEGGAPPPPDSSVVETPEVPRSLEPSAAPSPVPGLRGTPAFTWGDSTGLVLPPLADVRSAREIAADRDASRALRSTSENRMLKARERSVRWKAQVEIQKAREETLRKQADVAKKEKREADRKDFDTQRKREEKVRGYYDAMRQALEAEADFHKSAFDYAQARLAALDAEEKLGERWGGGGYETRISSDARSLEERVQRSVKERADRMSTYASRERSLADKRLAALRTWGELQK
jgi:hypothetical protein